MTDAEWADILHATGYHKAVLGIFRAVRYYKHDTPFLFRTHIPVQPGSVGEITVTFNSLEPQTRSADSAA